MLNLHANFRCLKCCVSFRVNYWTYFINHTALQTKLSAHETDYSRISRLFQEKLPSFRRIKLIYKLDIQRVVRIFTSLLDWGDPNLVDREFSLLINLLCCWLISPQCVIFNLFLIFLRNGVPYFHLYYKEFFKFSRSHP